MTPNVTGKLYKGGAWLAGARILINVVKAASTILIAWFLSPEDYGMVAIAATMLMLAQSMTEMQLGEALISHRSADDDAIDTVWTLGVIRGVILSLLLAATALPLAAVYDDDRLTPIMLVLSLQPLFSGPSNPHIFIQQRKLNFLQEFTLTVGQKMLGAVLMITLAVVLQSYWALILGSLFEAVVGLVLSFALVRYRPKFSFAGIRDIWGFSVWLSLGQIINTLNWRVEYLFIGKWLDLPKLGLYRLGSNLAQLPTQELMIPVRKVIHPGLAAVLNDPDSSHDARRIRIAYQRAQSLTTAMALFVGICFAMLSDTLIATVLDERWQGTGFIVQYLSAVFAFQTLGALVQPLAMAKNETRRLFIRDVQMLCIRLPIILGALYLWSLPGVVVARMISGAISVAINMTLVRRLIDLPVRAQFHTNMRSIAAVAIMALVLWGVDAIFADNSQRLILVGQLVLEFAVAVFTYIATMATLWHLSGRPDGAETEFMFLLRRLRARSRTS
ncbi:MAG: lipopolysaccharide biosynthesis protein [Novosphingobium sp.]|nr:lipopolysaccharide biosynthesis protein [Novosphingobium sp.]